jgi:hypothetical protein
MIIGVDQTLDNRRRVLNVARADSLLLISFDPERRRISALSIPRDTRAQIPGYGETKVNASYAYGGPRLTIKTVETENEGLKRAFMLTIPAEDIDARVNEEVKRIAPQVRMPGFRPGKVPANLIRKMHGEALQQEALSGAVQEGVQTLLEQQKIRPAMQPEVELDKTYEPGKDAEVTVRVEALPEIPEANIDGLKLERLTVEVPDSVVEEQLQRLAGASKNWKDAAKSHKAQSGDLAVVDFKGSVGGKEFEGGTGEDMQVELGVQPAQQDRHRPPLGPATRCTNGASPLISPATGR